MSVLRRLGGFLLLVWALANTAAPASPVLMISADGLRPVDILQGEKAGIASPTLHAMMAHGAYAEGIVGVLPTLTYPSHTTLITGVSPGRHGVTNNLTFDPLNINQLGWDWYAADIKVPTLWSAARAAGLRTANVHWPVSVSAPADDNLPQIWRTGHEDDRKLLAALATPGLLPALEAELGPYPQGIDESVEADELRCRFAAAIIARDHPAFTTVYLASVDHMEHHFGVDSAQAKEAITRNDAMIGRLVAAARAVEPDLTVVVVSDHGFQPVSTDVNLYAPFIAAGLISVDKFGKVTDWQAEPWLMGGSAAIVLRHPADATVLARAKAVVDRLAADPKNGIARVLDAVEVRRMGGAPGVSLLIAFRPGFEPGHDPAGPPLAPSTYLGMHGYLPSQPSMRSVLFVEGAALRRHGDLGVLDMRTIAPSVARMLGAAFPSAELAPAF